MPKSLSRSASVKRYWAELKAVNKISGVPISSLRKKFSGHRSAISAIVQKNTKASYKYHSRKVLSARAEKYVSKETDQALKLMSFKYGYQRLERFVYPPGSKPPKGISKRAWGKIGYIPKGGAAKGMRVVYYDRYNDKWIGGREMRKLHFEFAAFSLANTMARDLLKGGDISVNELPNEMLIYVGKAAKKRGYMTVTELHSFAKKILKASKDPYESLLLQEIIGDLWPELDYYVGPEK